jgi:hypothetical protein
MNDFPNEAVPWGGVAAAAQLDEEQSDMDAWVADAALGPASSRKVETVSARSAPALAAGLFRYGPHAALTACMIAVASMAGSHFVGPARTVEQKESVRSTDTGHAAQKMAEDFHAQEADAEDMRAAQILSTKVATGLGSTKPRLDVAKTEINAAIPDASGKVGHLRSKSAEKLPKTTERVDRIGLKIAALLAAAPVTDHSVSAASVVRKRAQGGRGDAFDPSEHPNAPGAPRPLGTIAPAATAKNSAAEYAYGQRAN